MENVVLSWERQVIGITYCEKKERQYDNVLHANEESFIQIFEKKEGQFVKIQGYLFHKNLV